MAEFVKVSRQAVPAQRFIGKQYGDADRVDGSFGQAWGAFFENGWMATLDALIPKDAFEDAGAHIGLMRWKDGEPFEYWIGMFTPAGTAVPEGMDCVDFEASALGVVWVQGPEDTLYMQEEKCAGLVEQAGYKIIDDDKGAWWFFERYACPRFTTPNDKGEVILDICHYIK